MHKLLLQIAIGFLFLNLVSLNVSATETEIKGMVTDQITGKPLPGAHILIREAGFSTVTNDEGSFVLLKPESGIYKLEVSFLGYESIKHQIQIDEHESPDLNISLTPTIYRSDEVVITASRSTDGIRKIPARVDIITRRDIEKMPHAKVEEILRYSAGVNVFSSGGMYSMRPVVTLRGLSGDEQGRTLVLVDGVPVNKGDTGGVNWSRFNPDDIERIEVFHGPGSSIYGNNAMGGVINIITRKPTERIEGSAKLSYGTYNTLMSSLNVGSSFKNGLYFTASGMYNTSDGYNDLPTEFREEPDYSVSRFLDEYSVSTKAGWMVDPMLNLEFQYDHYRNKKGEGEKILAPEGEYRHFDTDFLGMKINGNNGRFSYNLNVFYQKEDYYKLDERMRGGDYSRFDVKSDRIDKGAVLNLSNQISGSNKLVYGAEARFGSVDGGDYYFTSPDSVVNKGKLDTYALYLQDEQKLFDEKLSLNIGVRFDHARFHGGSYFSTDGSWTGYLPELKDHFWSAVSPRVGITYQMSDNSRLFSSWSRGFRASILDDLCRSGWMWVGPKIANPDLGPEKIDNFEMGADVAIHKNIKLAPTVFYARGRDFLYYVATGDSLWGKRPIYQRQNITEVRIFGFEIRTSANLGNHIQVFANYNFTHSKIGKFEKDPPLEGKMLKYSPKNQAKAGIVWTNQLFSVSFASVFKDKQFTTDDNSGFIDPYITFDGKLSKTLTENFSAYAEIRDIFNNRHNDSEYYLSPGRLITIGAKFKF